MAHSIPFGWMQAAAIALVAGVVSSTGTMFLMREPPSPASPVATSEAKLDRVIALLDEWRGSDGRRAANATEASSQLAAATSTEPTRTPATPPPTDDRMERLESEVHRLTEMLIQQSASVAMPIPRHAPIVYSEIAALHALDQRDRDAAQRSTVFLTPLEAVHRFGFPDEIGPANGSDFYWTYRAPPGAENGGMMLVFRSGYVAFHELR